MFEISLHIFLHYPTQLCGVRILVGSKIKDEKESGFEFLKVRTKQKLLSECRKQPLCDSLHLLQENRSMFFQERRLFLQSSSPTTSIIIIVVTMFQQGRNGSDPFYGKHHPTDIIPSQKSYYLVKPHIYLSLFVF